MHRYFVYILARRAQQHKRGEAEGFTKKYRVHQLVYFEETNDINAGIAREKQLKKWNRQWKIDLIENVNPEWKDLYGDFMAGFPLSRE